MFFYCLSLWLPSLPVSDLSLLLHVALLFGWRPHLPIKLHVLLFLSSCFSINHLPTFLGGFVIIMHTDVSSWHFLLRRHISNCPASKNHSRVGIAWWLFRIEDRNSVQCCCWSILEGFLHAEHLSMEPKTYSIKVSAARNGKGLYKANFSQAHAHNFDTVDVFRRQRKKQQRPVNFSDSYQWSNHLFRILEYMFKIYVCKAKRADTWLRWITAGKRCRCSAWGRVGMMAKGWQLMLLPW